MSTDDPDYNQIFERLAGQPDDDPDIVGLVAYGLYKQAKREWAAKIRSRESRGPTDAELRDYVNSWTESRLDGLIHQAEQWLGGYADEVISAQRPYIERDALKGSFGRGLLQSALGTLLYTSVLLLLYAVIYFAGIDVISVFGNN